MEYFRPDKLAHPIRGLTDRARGLGQEAVRVFQIGNAKSLAELIDIATATEKQEKAKTHQRIDEIVEKHSLADNDQTPSEPTPQDVDVRDSTITAQNAVIDLTASGIQQPEIENQPTNS